MHCYCKAELAACDSQNEKCPASTHRIRNDYPNAISELYAFAELDEAQGEEK